MLQAAGADALQSGFAGSLPDWVNAFATIAAAVVAYIAWLDWKRQELARRRSQFAEEVLFNAELAAATLQQALGTSGRVETCAAGEVLKSTAFRVAAIRASNTLRSDLAETVARLKAAGLRARFHLGEDVAATVSSLVQRFEQVQGGAVMLRGLVEAGDDSPAHAVVLNALQADHLHGFGLDITMPDATKVSGRSARDIGAEVQNELQTLTTMLEGIIRLDDISEPPARRSRS